MKRKWFEVDVTILGLSLSGISAAKYLALQGANCTISEKRQATVEDNEKITELEKLGIKVEMGGNKEETILNSDVIITSPGIPPHAEVYKLINARKIETFGEIDLAYKETNVPFIAITGTNGKTTTTKLVSEILTNSGLKAPACGNIGLPPTSLLDEKNLDYFVAEVSSYQIATNPSFKPQIAVFINYAPDHIDWHGNAEEYFKAKADLFTRRQPTWAVLNAMDFKIAYLKLETESEVYFFGREAENKCVFIKENKILIKDKNKNIIEVIKLDEIPLKGKHNLENIMSAIAVAHIAGIDAEIIKSTIKNFSPPEHRIEYVDTIDGIEYYNDSKGTNCDSTICALRAFEDKKVVLIAGGRDKGTDLTEFCAEVNKHANAVILIGEASDRFEAALIKSGFKNIYKKSTFEEAIDTAGKLNLGSVLLSPACASFDMFKNFEERGQVFKDYVRNKKTSR
ncbi:MAG: UDP-N-acetylmuramoylalanine--D-glutamate ligase [Candidatus Melainabacteria bacterium GWF2_32_7]|nr:MAG: UDP-N-acetylmuramoylalanine--D-glutamate ligase [Candidatus Melainabacteria bacterium GWF2_32_7]